MSDRPKYLSELSTPCLVVDINKVSNNCEWMRSQCAQLGVSLRPHMSAHKTIEAALLMTDRKRRCIAVSTTREAEFYADFGFDDILLTSASTPDKVVRLRRLAEKLALFHVLVDCDHTLDLLEKTAPKKGKKWSIVLHINCGDIRNGLDWADSQVYKLAQRIKDSGAFNFHGVYGHEGHVYLSKDPTKVQGLGEEAAEKLLQVTLMLKVKAIESTIISTGSSPTCLKPGELMGKLNEFHPGRYIFNDLLMCAVGGCTRPEVAARVATRVIAHNTAKGQLLIDCGFLAISPDGKDALGNDSYALVDGHGRLRVTHLAQEHGVIQAIEGFQIKFREFPIGSVVYLYPYNIRSTAALHPVYYVHTGETIVETWRPCRGW